MHERIAFIAAFGVAGIAANASAQTATVGYRFLDSSDNVVATAGVGETLTVEVYALWTYDGAPDPYLNSIDLTLAGDSTLANSLGTPTFVFGLNSFNYADNGAGLANVRAGEFWLLGGPQANNVPNSEMSLFSFTIETLAEGVLAYDIQNGAQTVDPAIALFSSQTFGSTQVSLNPGNAGFTSVEPTLAIVPEPASLALLGVGGLVLFRRRTA